jgi:hypothetical protein
MYIARRQFLPLLLIGILLTSCGGQVAAGEPTPNVEATIAAGAQTMVAAVFQTQTAAAPTASNTRLLPPRPSRFPLHCPRSRKESSSLPPQPPPGPSLPRPPIQIH